jgi:ubiquitin carboxyl-terminal hydrolase 22/27/51
MARSDFMPSTACEHLDASSIKKILAFRSSSSANIDLDFTTYTCITCQGFASGFQGLDKHFSKTKHESAFATSPSSVYCGECRDLIYDPSLIVRTGRNASAISSKPTINYTNGVKRKHQEISDEDAAYIAANTLPQPCGRAGVRGLFNLGETCYMNAVLQMMVHNPLLASYFLGMGHSVHTCPITNDVENRKPRDDSDGDEEGEDGEKEQQTCVACGMTEVFSEISLLDQPIPTHAVPLLFASWKNIPVGQFHKVHRPY